MKRALPTILALLTGPAFAADDRALGAHEHGVGELNIAVDGQTVAIEFYAPGADIVGFEYKATTANDRAAIDDAVAILARPLDLFVAPEAAECSVVKASAALESEDDHHDHGDHKDDVGHEEHAHEHDHDDQSKFHAEGEKHDHGEHAEHKHDHDNHDHKERASGEGHTEFHAEYVLACANPDAFTSLEFAYFQTFENAREVEVRLVTSAGAKAFEVAREAPILDLRGAF
ncbi:MAG: DUF2796 domain-containing protein [Pseudomonadota bacterium]